MLLGFWLGDGSVGTIKQKVQFRILIKQHDFPWLEDGSEILGLVEGIGYTKSGIWDMSCIFNIIGHCVGEPSSWKVWPQIQNAAKQSSSRTARTTTRRREGWCWCWYWWFVLLVLVLLLLLLLLLVLEWMTVLLLLVIVLLVLVLALAKLCADLFVEAVRSMKPEENLGGVQSGSPVGVGGIEKRRIYTSSVRFQDELMRMPARRLRAEIPAPSTLRASIAALTPTAALCHHRHRLGGELPRKPGWTCPTLSRLQA
jgi:hypothetical protein